MKHLDALKQCIEEGGLLTVALDLHESRMQGLFKGQTPVDKQKIRAGTATKCHIGMGGCHRLDPKIVLGHQHVLPYRSRAGYVEAITDRRAQVGCRAKRVAQPALRLRHQDR